jgi:hypothetical protein
MHLGCAGMLLLALQDVQLLLAAPDLSAELLFVLALVLSLCSERWPGDDGVVRPLYILIPLPWVHIPLRYPSGML